MILVTGATGLNGGALVRLLSARGVPVRALVRDPARAAALAALPHVEIAVGDMARSETLAAPLKGVTRAMLISSSVPTMTEVQSTFIDAAKKAGVRHVIKLSGIIPDVKSAFRFGRMHGEIEKYLESSGLAFTHLRAGEFMHSYFRQVPMILGKVRCSCRWKTRGSPLSTSTISQQSPPLCSPDRDTKARSIL